MPRKVDSERVWHPACVSDSFASTVRASGLRDAPLETAATVESSFQSTPQSEGVVSLIGGDPLTRAAVMDVANVLGLETRGFAAIDTFLADPPTAPGCVVVDGPLRPVGSSVIETLRRSGVKRPIILACGPTTVSAAVRAMEAGAAAVVEKPVSADDLMERIIREVAADRRRTKSEAERNGAATRLERLTAKEERTLALVLDGKTNRQIAEELGLSVRAVEDRRARTIKRAGVRNVLELARLVQMTGWRPATEQTEA